MRTFANPLSQNGEKLCPCWFALRNVLGGNYNVKIYDIYY